MIKQKLNEKSNKGNVTIAKQKVLQSYDHYIALDWSIINMAIARLTPKANEPKIIDVPSDIKELKLYLKNLQGTKIMTIEETTTSHWLYVELYDYADRIIICDPYRNRLLSDGPKNDKIDAGKLCLLLKNGMLKEVFHSNDKLYELRKLVSYYDDEVKAGVRLMNQKSALFRAENKSYKKKETIEATGINKFIVSQLDEKINLYIDKKQNYEDEFYKITKGNKTIKSLMSIPGIGIISSVTILSTVVDARRFKSSNHYLSYCGLANHKKMSGGRNYGKRLPRYSRKLKSVYKSAAVRVISANNPIKEYYDYLIKEKSVTEQNANNAVARYIARVSLGIIKSGKKFKPYSWRKNRKEKDVA